MGLPTRAELADQLIRLIDTRLVDPLDVLLDGHDAVRSARMVIDGRAGIWAHRLLQGTDAEAVGLIGRFIAALYPGDRGFDPPAEWWRTPLGRVVVWRAGYPDAEAVSYATAGAMLGISRQGVHDLVQRGKLLRHPDGGVVPASVRARFIATSGIDPAANGSARSTKSATSTKSAGSAKSAGSTAERTSSEGRAHA
jgi:hypothetical protein